MDEYHTFQEFYVFPTMFEAFDTLRYAFQCLRQSSKHISSFDHLIEWSISLAYTQANNHLAHVPHFNWSIGTHLKLQVVLTDLPVFVLRTLDRTALH